MALQETIMIGDTSLMLVIIALYFSLAMILAAAYHVARSLRRVSQASFSTVKEAEKNLPMLIESLWSLRLGNLYQAATACANLRRVLRTYIVLGFLVCLAPLSAKNEVLLVTGALLIIVLLLYVVTKWYSMRLLIRMIKLIEDL